MAYEHGHLVKKNLNSARIYYQRAAHAGNAEAEYNLAVFYNEGWGGLSKNKAKARELLESAAEAGVGKAQRCLGLKTVTVAELEEEQNSARDLYRLGRSFEDLGEVSVALDMYDKAEKAGYIKAGRARQRLSSSSS